MWKYGQIAFATLRVFFRATFDNGLPIDFVVLDLFWLVQKKEITTNSLRWPRAIHQIKTAKNSASERFVSLTDDDAERFVEAEANKNTQRKMHSDVVLMKSFLPNENETRQLQDIPPSELDAYLSRFLLSVRKKSVMNMSQQHSEELSLLWSIWETYAAASLLSKDNVRQLNCSRGTCLSEFLNLETRLWISLCVALCLGFAEFEDDHIRVNR